MGHEAGPLTNGHGTGGIRPLARCVTGATCLAPPMPLNGLRPVRSAGRRKPSERIDTPTGAEVVARLLGSLESGSNQ